MGIRVQFSWGRLSGMTCPQKRTKQHWTEGDVGLGHRCERASRKYHRGSGAGMTLSVPLLRQEGGSWSSSPPPASTSPGWGWVEGDHNPRLWGKQPVSAKGRSEAGLSLPFANLWTQISKSSPPLRLSPPSWRDEYLLLLFRIHPQKKTGPRSPTYLRTQSFIYVSVDSCIFAVWLECDLKPRCCSWFLPALATSSSFHLVSAPLSHEPIILVFEGFLPYRH